jgi:hypothetical protein
VHDISPGILVTRFDNNHLSSHSVDVNFTNEGFKYCLEIASDPSFNSPQLPDYIVKLIQRSDHFESNEGLSSLLLPVMTLMNRFKDNTANLSDVWLGLPEVY